MSECAGQVCVAVLLSDIKFFIRDCLGLDLLRALGWLWVLAQSPPEVVTGEEDVSWEDAASVLEGAKAVQGAETVLFEIEQSQEHSMMQQLHPLTQLRFHAGGSVITLSFVLEPQEHIEASWSFLYSRALPAYRSQLKKSQPGWFLRPHDCLGEYGQDGDVVRAARNAEHLVSTDSVRIMPAVCANGKLFVFLVLDGGGSFGVLSLWTSIGGGVKRGTRGDKTLSDTLKREWEEEVIAYPWGTVVDEHDATEKALVVWKANSPAWSNSHNCQGISSSAWCLVPARQDFFRETVGLGCVQLCPKGLEVARGDSPDDVKKRVHTHGIPFVEHEVGAWFQLDPNTGKLWSQEAGAGVRGDLGQSVFGQPARRKRLVELIRGSPECDVDGLVDLHHPVEVTPDGLQGKDRIVRRMSIFRSLTPEQATATLTDYVTAAPNCYPEVVKFLLEDCAANPQGSTADTPLSAVLRASGKISDSPCIKMTRGLLSSYGRLGLKVSKEELDLIDHRAKSASKDYVKMWSELAKSLQGELRR